MGSFFQRGWPIILLWFLGNFAWSAIVFILGKYTEETAMMMAIGSIGFLVLILTAIIGTGWYVLQGRTDSATEITLDNMARRIAAIYFAQKHDVEPDALVELNSVEAMEERALRIVAETKLDPTSDNIESDPSVGAER